MKINITIPRGYEKLQLLFEIAFIFRPIIRAFVNFLFRTEGEDNSALEYAYLAVGIVIILFAINEILSVIKIRDYFIYALVVSYYFLSYFIYPENAYWLTLHRMSFLLMIFPYFFLGLLMSHIEIRMDRIIMLSRISILVQSVALLRYKGIVYNADEQMGRAYTMLPILMIVTISLINHFRRVDAIFVAIGIVNLLLDAARGPIFLYVIFLVAITVLYKHYFISLLISLFGALFFIKSIRNGILLALIDIFSKLRFNTRVFYYIINNDASNLNYRDVAFYAPVKNMIDNNPFGNGIFSDRRAIRNSRNYLDNQYTHNIIYELQCDYGKVVGILFLLIFLLIIMIAFIKIRGEKRALLLMLVCSTFIKLFFSGSYLEERWLYVLLGFSFAVVFNLRNEHIDDLRDDYEVLIN